MADVESDDPYSPSGTDQDTQTRTLAEVMRIAIDQWVRNNLNVWLPCQVVNVRNNSTVDVKICIMENFKVQGLVSVPPLLSIPVEHPRGENWWIKLPVQVGDYGRVNFADRSLDQWLQSGGVDVDPQDTRMHNRADATYTPGLYPKSSVLPGAATDMILNNGNAQFYLQAAGTFKMINTSSGQELFQNLIALVSTLQTASTVLGGPFINTVVEQLQQIVQNLTGMKGS